MELPAAVSPPPPLLVDDPLARSFRRLRPGAAAPLWALVLVGFCAVVFVLSFNGGVGGFGFFAFVCVLIAAVYAAGARNATQVVTLACAWLTSMIWVFRESGWMRLSSALLVLACLLVAVTVARSRPLFDIRWADIMTSTFETIASSVLVPPWLLRGIRRACPPVGTAQAGVIARLLLLGMPLLIVIAGLLAWADAPFAAVFDVSMSAARTDTILFLVGVAVVAWILRCAVVRTSPAPQRARPLRASFVETVVVLGGIALLLAMFVLVQIDTARTAGESTAKNAVAAYAGDARSGYIQLLAVVALVATTLVAFDRLTSHELQWQRWTHRCLSLAIVCLTLAVTALALRRVALYSEAFGLTMLRLVSIPFAAWMVVLLLLVALSVSGIGRRRSWLPGVAGLSFVFIWLAFAAVNPQAVMVDYDFAHASVERLDVRYLSSLSSDATPALADHLTELPPEERDYVVRRLCPRTQRPVGLAQLSVSKIRARQALESLCS